MEAAMTTAEVVFRSQNLAAVDSLPNSVYEDTGDWKTWEINSDMAFSNSLSYALENSLKLWQV